MQNKDELNKMLFILKKKEQMHNTIQTQLQSEHWDTSEIIL